MERNFSEFRESTKLLKHEFKEPLYDMCLLGTAVACWSLPHEVACLNRFDDKYF